MKQRFGMPRTADQILCFLLANRLTVQPVLDTAFLGEYPDTAYDIVDEVFEHANVFLAHVDSLTTQFELEPLTPIEITGTYTASSANLM